MRSFSYPHILAGACSMFLSSAAQADQIAPLAFTTQVQSSRVIQVHRIPSSPTFTTLRRWGLQTPLPR